MNAAIDMSNDASRVQLLPHPPELIARFFSAVNESDASALVQLFATDALVNDQLRDFWGSRSIEEWIRSEVTGDRLRARIVKVVQHFDDYIVTAHVDGDFDKTGLPDPLELTFHFSLRDAGIARLIVLHNHPPNSRPELRTPRA